MPALWRIFQIGSLRIALKPFVQLYCHRCQKLPLVHSISQMVAIGAAGDVSWQPDLHRRHELADGVYYLPGNAFRLFRAGAGLFEPGIEARK